MVIFLLFWRENKLTFPMNCPKQTVHMKCQDYPPPPPKKTQIVVYFNFLWRLKSWYYNRREITELVHKFGF